MYNGSDANAAVVGTYCGDILPQPIFASGNDLFIRFVTDSSVTRGGYDASFTSSSVQGKLTLMQLFEILWIFDFDLLVYCRASIALIWQFASHLSCNTLSRNCHKINVLL